MATNYIEPKSSSEYSSLVFCTKSPLNFEDQQTQRNNMNWMFLLKTGITPRRQNISVKH